MFYIIFTFFVSFKERVNSTKSRQTKSLSFIYCVCACVRACARARVCVCIVDKINIYFFVLTKITVIRARRTISKVGTALVVA